MDKGRIKFRSHKFFLGVLLLSVALPGQCLKVEKMSLEAKVKASDLVVIGQVMLTTLGCRKRNKCAKIKVSTVLKGKPRASVFVFFDGPIAEQNPLCCKVGGVYLFFLKHANRNFFYTADGPYGIYRILMEPMESDSID